MRVEAQHDETPTATPPAAMPAASARNRKRSASSSCPCRAASPLRKTAAVYAALVAARQPIATPVGLSQLETRLPPGLPTCTRPDAMPPAAVPSANGVSNEESAKTV